MFFPYLFCTKSNMHSNLSSLPPFSDYIPETMKCEKFDKFKKWYEENKASPFCLKDQLEEYCANDTLILLKALIAMRKILLGITHGYDVLPRSVSIAGIAMSVYKRCFVKDNTIGIIPEGGYEKFDKSSDKAIKLMSWISKTRNINVKHAGNGREHVIGNYKVDGFIDSEKRVLEFLGCYYHSHPDCTNANDTAPNGKLNAINYSDTMKRLEYIRKQGYQVETFWECQIDAEIKSNTKMREFFQNFEVEGSIGKKR